MNSTVLLILLLLAQSAGAAVIAANPSNYRVLLRTLKPGDTLRLAVGKYARLPITGLNGTESAWITITGPDSGTGAVIVGAEGQNTVEIFNSSYVAIENLLIDSAGIPGSFGISAKGLEENRTHHIRIEGNTFIGQNGGQQTVAVSTKTPTWGWIIRYNKILGAGTGMYLGNSDGTQPFVNGLIEYNLIKDTIGYNLQIKDQLFLPDMEGMPTEPASTIIRHNVFIKDDRPSPDGDRPNLLVGSFPATGPGSMNMYEIYGNYFGHNQREALFQGSGRISLHDNVFVEGPNSYPAVVLRKHNYPLKVAIVYNNTVYTLGKGIHIGTGAEVYDAVAGNLVFASEPVSGFVMRQSGNIVDHMANAAAYVKSPSFNLASMDFYPLPGKCQGPPIDISEFHRDADYSADFNSVPKVQSKEAVVYRGAYAGAGANPGWKLAAGLKHPIPPAPAPVATVVWVSPATGHAGTKAQVTLTGANFTTDATVAVAGPDIEVTDVKVAGPTKLTANLKISPKAAPGIRGVTVLTPSGISNTTNFRVNSRTQREVSTQ